MQAGRSLLRYFTESDLQPSGTPDGLRTEQDVNLLGTAELEDLKIFSDKIGRYGEVGMSRTELMRKPHLRTFAAFLQALGALRLHETPDEIRFKFSGRLAGHVPEILYTYLAESLTIVDNWSRTHIIPEDALSALELLQQMELRRIELTRRAGRTPKALAVRPVAFAIFHAIDHRGADCYLFEINKDWRRLNFIGGKQEPVDRGDYQATVIREIGEELGIPRQRLTLTRLNDEPLKGYSLSGNVGSLASYPCVLFGVKLDGTVPTRMQDRWLTERDLKTCMEIDDCPLMVNPVYMQFLLEGNPPRLSTTPITTEARVRPTDIRDIVPHAELPLIRWARVLRENKDLLAAILTLVAALITVILAV